MRAGGDVARDVGLAPGSVARLKICQHFTIKMKFFENYFLRNYGIYGIRRAL